MDLSAPLKQLHGQYRALPFVLRVAPGRSKGLPPRASLDANPDPSKSRSDLGR
jgi:hypothetical protein